MTVLEQVVASGFFQQNFLAKFPNWIFTLELEAFIFLNVSSLPDSVVLDENLY